MTEVGGNYTRAGFRPSQGVKQCVLGLLPSAVRFKRALGRRKPASRRVGVATSLLGVGGVAR